MIRRVWKCIRPEYKPGIITLSEFAWAIVPSIIIGMAGGAAILYYSGAL